MSERTVVQVTLWNSPYLGNFMLTELALAAAVRDRLGLASHFVLADGAQGQPWLEDLDRAGVSWSVLPPGRSGWRGALQAVVRERAAALVDTHFTAADIPAALVARGAGIPCLWHIRTGFNGYPLRQRAKDLFKLRLFARRYVSGIIVVSPWLGELARSRGLPDRRILVTPNPIASERFASLPDRERARERFGLEADAEVVLALGWWPHVKGVDLLMDALAEVELRRPAAQALLVGEGAMRSFIAGRHQRAPGSLRLSGFVANSAWLFAAADVFVSASRHEGQSSAVGEALACGLPVIMSDIPGTAGWSQAPGVREFPSEDTSALAREITAALEDHGGRSAAAGAGRRAWIAEHAGVEGWSRALCEIYESLL